MTICLYVPQCYFNLECNSRRTRIKSLIQGQGKWSSFTVWVHLVEYPFYIVESSLCPENSMSIMHLSLKKLSSPLRISFPNSLWEKSVAFFLFLEKKKKTKKNQKKNINWCRWRKTTQESQCFKSTGLAARYPCKISFLALVSPSPSRENTHAAYVQSVSTTPPALPQPAGVWSSHSVLSDSCHRMIC